MIRTILAIFPFLCVLCLSFNLQAQEDQKLTWAIVGDRTVLENGFADLLMVELDANDFQLVERIQLREFEREMERFLESGSLSGSMSIGRRLGAQRLIVCQHQLGDTQPEKVPLSLRVFVCDCDLAARIAVADFDLSDAATIADKVTEWLTSVRTSPRIEQVVGLAPFACKNLGDAFLDIGKQAHHFLSGQLLAIPGVALVEWEETRAMNRETNGTFAAEKRMVPWLMAVDYQVIPNSQNSPPLVEVSLSVRSTNQPTFESATLSLLELESWLRLRILGGLLKDKPVKNGLSQVEQLRFLKSRAQSLFRLGAALTSAQVREVILQMDPADFEERLRLMSDYGICTKTIDQKRRLSLYPLTTLEIQARSFQREHFEYLVRNNQISFADALERFSTLVIDPYSKLALTRISPKYALSKVDLVRTLGSLEQDLQFVRTVGPAILKMNGSGATTNETVLKQRIAWSQAVLAVARLNAWFHFGSEESRITTIRLITDIIPQDYPTITTGEWLFDTKTFPKARVQHTDLSTRTTKQVEVGNWPEEVLDLYQKYDHSGHRHVRLYLRLARINHLYAAPLQLGYAFASNAPESRASLSKIDAELQEIRQEAMQAFGAEERGLVAPPQIHLDYVYDKATAYSLEAKRRVAGTPTPTSPDLPRPKPELGRLRFQELNLQLPQLSDHLMKWQADGPDHDLVYDRKSVYRLNRLGTFEKISPEKGYTFIDDELIWLLDRKKSGEVYVSANDRQGQELLRDQPLELPPFVDFQVMAAGARKGIIIGWFEGGTWCGLMEQTRQTVSFRVIHEAREYQPSPVAKDVKVASQSAGMRFEPRWHARGTDAKGECLLVGRFGMTPLRIDLETWKVNVVPLENADFLLGTKIASQKFYQCEYAFVFEHDLNSTKPSISRKMVIGMDHMEQIKKGNTGAGNNEGTMLLDGEWLVLPGSTWYRYNIIKGDTERLVATALPRPFDQGGTGQSSIHGLVQWQTENSEFVSRLYQVIIEADSPSSRTFAVESSDFERVGYRIQPYFVAALCLLTIAGIAFVFHWLRW